MTTHEVECNIYARYAVDADVHDLLTAATEDVIAAIDAWPHLDSTPGIFEAFVIGGDPFRPVFRLGESGPHQVQRTINIRIVEDVDVTERE